MQDDQPRTAIVAVYCFGVVLLAQVVGTLIHEFGHVLNGIATGGGFDQIEYSVLGWSHAYIYPLGEARAVSWGGVQWATTVSLFGFLLCWILRSRAVFFFLVLAAKGFASAGQYLIVGVFTGEGDSANLLRMGLSEGALVGVGSALLLPVIPLAALVAPLLGMGRRRNACWRTLVVMAAPIILMSLAVFAYNMIRRPEEWPFWASVCAGAVVMSLLAAAWSHVAAPWFRGNETVVRRQLVAGRRAAFSMGVAVLVAVVATLSFPRAPATLARNAIQDGRMDEVKRWVRADNVNAPELADRYWGYPLHVAVLSQRTNIVEHLLDVGAEVNARNSQGRTPLHAAINQDDLPLAEILLAEGADINAMSRFGSPLHGATYSGNTNIISWLIAAGADPSATNRRGRTAADIARWYGHKEVLPLLTAEP